MIEQYVWVEQSSLEFWNLWTGEFRVQNLWTAVSNLFLKNMWIEQSGLQFWNLWGGEFGIQSRGLEGPFLFFKHLWTENSSLGCKCTKICCLTQLWVKKWLPKQLLKNIELFSLFHSKCLVQKNITYLPHKAVAEVSKDKEPIGRKCAEFNWFEIQLMSDSNELRVKWFGCHLIWDSNDFGCQLIWDSIDLVVNWFEIQIWLSIDVCFKWFWLSVDLNFKWFGCQLIWDSSDSVVNWSEIQVIWLSTDLRFKWVGCQLILDSSDLDVKWFEVQVIWLSTDAWFKWFCQTKLLRETSFKIEALKLKNEAFLRDLRQKRSLEDQKWSFSARLPSKLKLWSSKTKLFCETSFKNEGLKLKNEAFLRDFLQNWSFEDQKRSISARLPSKLQLSSSKTKLFCETSFKNEGLKLKNEAFVRDFLQNWHVEQTLDLRIPIRFSDFQVDASKVLRLPRESWAEAYQAL